MPPTVPIVGRLISASAEASIDSPLMELNQNLRCVRDSDDETLGAIQVRVGNTFDTVAIARIKELQPTFLRRAAIRPGDSNFTEADFLGSLSSMSNTRILNPLFPTSELTEPTYSLGLAVPKTTVAGESLGQGDTPADTAIGPLDKILGLDDFSPTDNIIAQFSAPENLTIAGREFRLYKSNGLFFAVVFRQTGGPPSLGYYTRCERLTV